MANLKHTLVVGVFAVAAGLLVDDGSKVAD